MKKSFRFLLVVFIAVCCFTASSMRSAAQEPMGGEFALTFGAQTGPFKMGTGWFLAGEIGLPLMDLGPGKVLGLVNIGMSNSDDNISIEPTVNALVPNALPTQTTIDLTTVAVVLGLKYKLMAHNVVQPYILGGPGIDIFFNDTEPGDLPGAIAPQPQELIDRGFPGGQGNVELGLHVGGGIDINITEKIFIGAEGRFNWVDRENGSYGTYGGRLGFRF
jgi:opacity protein-like surface antigen